MKTIKKQTQEIEVIESITCDCCGRVIPIKDTLDFYEIWSIQKVGGYGSVFGDGNVLELDLCEYCAKDLLGKYIRITAT